VIPSILVDGVWLLKAARSHDIPLSPGLTTNLLEALRPTAAAEKAVFRKTLAPEVAKLLRDDDSLERFHDWLADDALADQVRSRRRAAYAAIGRACDLLRAQVLVAARLDAGEDALFLSELTLDPPEATGAEAGAPELDEDYLILSTIHSAKGQEWDAVFVLNVVDGCIPSDMGAGSPAQIEEERRLLYVAMTRAKQHLHLVQPLRFFRTQQHRHGDRHMFAPRTRFIPDDILGLFERLAWPVGASGELSAPKITTRVDVAARMRAMWH
jgi:superfamily I DNA/RNA helicase